MVSKLRNFKVKDLVLIASHDATMSSWPLGRIIEVFIGFNYIFCTVKLKTRSEIVRLASRLALFEATRD